MSPESTILVLSGKADEPQSIARMLADRFRVVEAESPEEGLDQLSNGVEVVVADLETAKSAGLEFLRQGKARRPGTPVLAVTNGGDVNAAVEAMKLGAADCLVKPLQQEKLLETVSQLIDKRHRTSAGSDGGSQIDIPPGTSLEDLERAAVEQALAQHHGNRTHAAKTLGISVRTLQRKLKAWGIPIVSPHSSSGRSDNFIMPATGGSAGYSAPAHSAH
jgi:DNA-binding NtrC family response regulator